MCVCVWGGGGGGGGGGGARLDPLVGGTGAGDSSGLQTQPHNIIM